MVGAEEPLADGERFLVGFFSVPQISLLPERFAQTIKRRSSLSAAPSVDLPFVRQGDAIQFFSLIILADIQVEVCDQTAQMGFDCRLIAQFYANALGCPIQNVLQLDPDIRAPRDRISHALEHILQQRRHQLTLLASLSFLREQG